MIYKSFLPCPELSGFIRNYTLIHFQFNAGEPVPSKQRSPKPEEKIVFYLKGSISQHNPGTGHFITPPPVSVFSHQKERRTFQVTPEFRALLIFLRPGVLHQLTKIPLPEMPGECCDAELFFGTGVRTISDQLATAANHASMISIVEKYLITKCSQLKARTTIDLIASQLLNDPTFFSLDSLADQACLSTKQFYRKFNERIGISPKFFSMLSRFNHAYHYKLIHPEVAWSSIAQEFRYTDYHHLEKEFKAFAGFTPKVWVETHMTSPERILKLR